MRVSVIGGSSAGPSVRATAEELGRLVGEAGHTLVCGGLGGVMRAASAGATEAGGTTVGILPTADREAANDHVDVAVATGMGHARSALVPLNGDAVVAVDGGPGTLSELAYARVYGRPVAGLGTHDLEWIEAVAELAAALAHVERAVDGA